MNIILCGFMGAGKTRIGKEISKLTGREFIDTDDIAEEIAGKRRAADHVNAVISTGGGAVTFERNTEILKGSGIIIFIDASFAEIEKRIGDPTTRPLFKNKSNAEKLYNERKSKYEKACDASINGDGKPETIANEIINKTTELLNNRN